MDQPQRAGLLLTGTNSQLNTTCDRRKTFPGALLDREEKKLELQSGMCNPLPCSNSLQTDSSSPRTPHPPVKISAFNISSPQNDLSGPNNIVHRGVLCRLIWLSLQQYLLFDRWEFGSILLRLLCKPYQSRVAN